MFCVQGSMFQDYSLLLNEKKITKFLVFEKGPPYANQPE